MGCYAELARCCNLQLQRREGIDAIFVSALELGMARPNGSKADPNRRFAPA